MRRSAIAQATCCSTCHLEHCCTRQQDAALQRIPQPCTQAHTISWQTSTTYGTYGLLSALNCQAHLDLVVVEVGERCPRGVRLQSNFCAPGRGAPRQRGVQQSVRVGGEPEALLLPGRRCSFAHQLMAGRRLLHNGVRICPLYAAV